jgi:hypothetical protein
MVVGKHRLALLLLHLAGHPGAARLFPADISITSKVAIKP